MGLITLREIAQDVCIEDGDINMDYLERNISFCARAYNDLNLYKFPTLKTVRLEVSDIFTAPLPRDYVAYSKVGLLNLDNGRIVTLGYDENICPYTVLPVKTALEAAQQIRNVLIGNEDAGTKMPYSGTGSYGWGGGYNRFGFFREDRENWRLHFSSTLNIPHNLVVVLEYKADATLTGVKMVPSEAKEAIINFALSKANKKKDRGLSESYKFDWQMEYKRLGKLYSAMTAEEWQDLFKSNAKQTVGDY